MFKLSLFFILFVMKCIKGFDDCTAGQTQYVPGDCQKYRLCESSNFGSLFGVWKEHSCPEGFNFDSNSNVCLKGKDTNCDQKCIDKERLPYFENCVFFKECIKGTYNLFKCPRKYNNDGTWSNQMFDETTKKCVDKQRLAIPGNCQKYKECIMIGPAFNIEHWQEASCLSSMNFDPIASTCVTKNKYECYPMHTTTATTTTTTIINQMDKTLSGHGDWVMSVSFNSNDLLASGSYDRTVKIWDVTTGECIKNLTGQKGAVNSLSFNSQDLLASVSREFGSSCYNDYNDCDNIVQIWNVTTGECIKNLTGHSDLVRSVSFSSQGLLASGSDDSTVKIWDVTTGECIKTLIGHTNEVYSISFNSQGLLASGSDDHTVKIWNVTTGECIKTLTGHGNAVSSISFNSHHKLASGSWDGTVKIWNIL